MDIRKFLEKYMIGMFVVGSVAMIMAWSMLLSDTTIVNASEIEATGINKTVEPMDTDLSDTPCTNIVLTDEIYQYTVQEKISDVIPVEKPVVDELKIKYDTIFRWQSYNNEADFGVEQLHKLNEYCEEFDVPMELMLAIISWESSFESTALSDESTAAGYCQIIRKTAKAMYEDELKLGEYDGLTHEYTMTNDWELNLRLGCALMRYHNDNNYGSWEFAIHDYHGGTAEQNTEYFNYINTRLYKLFGISVCDIK